MLIVNNVDEALYEYNLIKFPLFGVEEAVTDKDAVVVEMVVWSDEKTGNAPVLVVAGILLP